MHTANWNGQCQLNSYPQKKTDSTFVQPISPNFIWFEESSEKFRFALCSTEIQSKLKNFNSNTIEGTEISVDGAAAELSEILFSAAKSSLNRCKVYKKDSPKTKKWFDKDLKKSRLNLINYGKIYSKFPRDNYVKNYYYKLQRE